MKTGRKEKDAGISDNFNMKKSINVHDLQKTVNRLMKELKETQEKAASREQKSADVEAGRNSDYEVPSDEDQLKSSMEMLDHLRYCYRNAKGAGGKKGRARLMQLMESDVEFKFAMRELMKIETSLAAAKIRTKEPVGGGGGNVTTFVILKGLHDDGKTIDLKAEGINSGLNLKQITNAINPAAEPQMEKFQEEIARPEAGR